MKLSTFFWNLEGNKNQLLVVNQLSQAYLVVDQENRFRAKWAASRWPLIFFKICYLTWRTSIGATTVFLYVKSGCMLVDIIPAGRRPIRYAWYFSVQMHTYIYIDDMYMSFDADTFLSKRWLLRACMVLCLVYDTVCHFLCVSVAGASISIDDHLWIRWMMLNAFCASVD